MPQVCIALGGNEGDVAQTLRRALDALGAEALVAVCAISSLYRSEALVLPGQPAQPHYLNAVVAGETSLPPDELVAKVHQLAFALGRRAQDARAARWQPRALDCDVLTYEGSCSSEPHCRLPHPQLPFRPFVLWPLAEVAPHLVVAPYAATPGQLLAKLARPKRGLLARSLSWKNPAWQAIDATCA